MSKTRSKIIRPGAELGFLYLAEEQRFIPITKSPFTLGRSEGDLVHKADPALSRKHCEIRIEGRTVALADLGSQNGTWLNGQKLPSGSGVGVHEGDVIQVGRMHLFFCWRASLPDSSLLMRIPGLELHPQTPSSKTVSRTLPQPPRVPIEKPKPSGKK